MDKNRLEAFSDAVLAIIITIMVLELKVPHGADLGTLAPLLTLWTQWIAVALYVVVALIWLIPDPRIERALVSEHP